MKRIMSFILIVALVAGMVILTPDGDAVASSYYQVISVAKGASINLDVKGKTIKKTTTANKKIVVVSSSKGGLIKAKNVGSTTVTVDCSDGKKYRFKIKVFDQMKFMLPDYTGITRENYLETLQKEKKKKDAILNCDKLVVMFDLYDGVYVDGGVSSQYFDSNLMDLFSDEMDFKIEYEYSNDKADFHCIELKTNDKGMGNYVDLTKSYKPVIKKVGKQEYRYTLSKQKAKQVRDSGNCWITGNGFKLYSVTVSGKPIKSYKRMTATKNSPVIKSGNLHIEGTGLKDEDNKDIRLLGVEFYWDSYGLMYANGRTLRSFNKLWGGNCVKQNMDPVDGKRGYLDKSTNKKEATYYHEIWINAAIESGMYVVSNWSLSDYPLLYIDSASEFFADVSKKYAKVPNVVYVICGEPHDNEKTPEKEDSWENIKHYTDKVLPVIRKNSPDSVIVVSGPEYSNDLQSRKNDPLRYDNIAYDDHIYEWMTTNIPDEVDFLESGLALFISETDASCNDDIVTNSEKELFNKYRSIWKKYNVSYIVGSFQMTEPWGNDLLKQKCGKRWDWVESDYTNDGKYLYHCMRQDSGLES